MLTTRLGTLEPATLGGRGRFCQGQCHAKPAPPSPTDESHRPGRRLPEAAVLGLPAPRPGIVSRPDVRINYGSPLANMTSCRPTTVLENSLIIAVRLSEDDLTHFAKFELLSLHRLSLLRGGRWKVFRNCGLLPRAERRTIK